MFWLRQLLARLTGAPRLPAEFRGVLEPEENVLAVAETTEGAVVATHLGLWLPEWRRWDWHLISKASFEDGTLAVTASAEIGTVDTAVLLRDTTPRRLRLSQPGRLPPVVHERVTGSIRSRHYRELPGGGAWVVQRKVPGRDGVVLQVRGDSGVDEDVVAALARAVSERVRGVSEPGVDTGE